MRPIGRRRGGPGDVCTGDRRGRVAAVATRGRSGWGASRCRSLELPACITQLRGGVVAPPASYVTTASVDGAPPTACAAVTRSLHAAPLPCSAARSRDSAPPSAFAARLRGSDAATSAGRHGEGVPSEPPRGGGEPSGSRGVGVLRGSAGGSYIDITGRPILISYNRPVYKKCAAAGKCNL
jgi:hypothetical protein